jgi:hypothetical protein
MRGVAEGEVTLDVPMLRVRSREVRGDATRGEPIAGGESARADSGISWYGAKLVIVFNDGARSVKREARYWSRSWS